jgi:hypothetical protein
MVQKTNNGFGLDYSIPVQQSQPGAGVSFLDIQNYATGSMDQNFQTSAFQPQETSMWEGFQNTLGDIFNKEAMFGSPQSDGKGGTIQGQGWTGQGLSALQGIGNYMMAQEQADMQRKQFGMQKSLANRNLDNQAQTVNEQMGLRAEAKGSLQGMTGDALSQYTDNYVKDHGIDGSPV